jgi:hypothetical protein
MSHNAACNAVDLLGGEVGADTFLAAMGSEVLTRVRIGDSIVEAKVLLETEELIVRGALKKRVAFRDITSIETRAGTLSLKTRAGAMSIELGDKAEAWATKIRAPKLVIDKLGVKSGQRVAIFGALDDEAFARSLRERATIEASGAKGLDAIFLVADEPRALETIGKRAKQLAPNGALWIVRAKAKDASVKENDVMRAGRGAGLTDVKVVKISEALSALKFVVPIAKR